MRRLATQLPPSYDEVRNEMIREGRFPPMNIIPAATPVSYTVNEDGGEEQVNLLVQTVNSGPNFTNTTYVRRSGSNSHANSNDVMELAVPQISLNEQRYVHRRQHNHLNPSGRRKTLIATAVLVIAFTFLGFSLGVIFCTTTGMCKSLNGTHTNP
ncbi:MULTISPECIES: hypothetical protein [Candidatus Ichthyocystis]|uniref:Putative membrane protein n=1 Tax=Candidatus Ichthyocystis hellenicum TaxID=1561003 RepID=A0A0S4M2E3_9BURK|nr:MULTISPECIES: hypothetical protein [Ichthyocystis]CUT17183.1 putative membrane protein [Candidatus Ichthyocystis hellenicum]